MTHRLRWFCRIRPFRKIHRSVPRSARSHRPMPTTAIPTPIASSPAQETRTIRFLRSSEMNSSPGIFSTSRAAALIRFESKPRMLADWSSNNFFRSRLPTSMSHRPLSVSRGVRSPKTLRLEQCSAHYRRPIPIRSRTPNSFTRWFQAQGIPTIRYLRFRAIKFFPMHH